MNHKQTLRKAVRASDTTYAAVGQSGESPNMTTQIKRSLNRVTPKPEVVRAVQVFNYITRVAEHLTIYMRGQINNANYNNWAGKVANVCRRYISEIKLGIDEEMGKELERDLLEVDVMALYEIVEVYMGLSDSNRESMMNVIKLIQQGETVRIQVDEKNGK